MSLDAANDLLTPAVSNATASNPFASCYTKPGALGYEQLGGCSPADVLHRFETVGRVGAIIGPHGYGKTSLLIELERLLTDRGEDVRRFDAPLVVPTRGLRRAVVLVDGFEQCPLWRRWRLAAMARRGGCGLIVTSHRSVGLPVLARPAPSPALVMKLFDRLTANLQTPISHAHVARALERNRGNVRETWFNLYDQYERRTRIRTTIPGATYTTRRPSE